VILGILLSWKVVPGVFIVDDNNYLVNVLALRQGRVTVANTEGLTPSRELLFFDPGPWARQVDSTPVASTAPPLYAPIALPFSLLRWRGLVALNTLAFLTTILLVFVYARRYAADRLTPWLATSAFGLGGYAIEYAQGLWPQTLSIALVAGGIFAAGRSIDAGRPSFAAAAGFLLALGTGVRYQNAVLLASVGAGITLWAVPRRTHVLAFVLAAALPIAASSAINYARLGSWNPITKGKGYLSPQMVRDPATPVIDAAVSLWGRVVDSSAQPPLTGRYVESWLKYEPRTGAHLMLGVTVKKAFLQSAPWTMLAFVMLGLSWWSGSKMPAPRRRQLRLLSMVTLSLLVVLALAGTRRHEGFAFNQRYLLELLPIAAVGFAWALDGLVARPRWLMGGAILGSALVLFILIGTSGTSESRDRLFILRQLAVLKLPLLLAALLGGFWWLARSRAHLSNLSGAWRGSAWRGA
jgi:hypothetical protein